MPERLPRSEPSPEQIIFDSGKEGVPPTPRRKRRSSATITMQTTGSGPVEEQREIDARAALLHEGKDPQGKKINELAAQLLAESGGSPPISREDLAKQLAEARVRAEDLEQRAETAEKNSGRLRAMLQRAEQDKNTLAYRARNAEGNLGALQREVDQATSGEATALDAFAEERELRLTAERRATAAEAELRRVKAQKEKSTNSNDPYGYYGKLGITREDFKGLTQEQIEKALNNIIRANTILLNLDQRVDLTEEEETALVKRLQEKNEAAENLKKPRYR